MVELESFYANLYDGSNCSLDSTTSTFLDVSRGFPALTDDLKNICEGKIGYSERFSVLGTFPKIKTPGNDGLTIEFYLAFWPLFGSRPFSIVLAFFSAFFGKTSIFFFVFS